MALLDFSKTIAPASSYQKVGEDYLTPEEVQQRVDSGQIQSVNVDPNQGNFSRGLTQAGYGLKATAGGLLGLAGGALGVDSLKNNGLHYAEKQLNLNQLYTKPTDSIAGIHSLSDAGAFAANQIGQQLPGLVAGIATGGAAGLGTGLLQRQLAKNVVDEAVASQVAKSALINGTGFKAGLFGFGAGQSAGTVYPEAIKNNVENPVSAGIVGGLVGGALNFAGDFALLNSLKNPIGGSTLLKNIGTNVATDVSINAGAGVGNVVSNRAFGGQSLADAEAVDAYLTAGAGGGIAGAGFGVVGGTLAKRTAKQNENTQNTNSPNGNTDVSNPVINPNNTSESIVPSTTMENGKRNLPIDLQSSDVFKTLAKDNPNLSLLDNFDEVKLKESGLTESNIRDIKNEYKTKDVLNREIEGYNVEDILTKNISNLTPEEITNIKTGIRKMANEYDDNSYTNGKFSSELNKIIDANYSNKENGNTLLQKNSDKIIDEPFDNATKPEDAIREDIVNKSEEEANVMQVENSSALNNDLTDFTTPTEKTLEIARSQDEQPIIQPEVTPEVESNIQKAQEENDVIVNENAIREESARDKEQQANQAIEDKNNVKTRQDFLDENGISKEESKMAAAQQKLIEKELSTTAIKNKADLERINSENKILDKSDKSNSEKASKYNNELDVLNEKIKTETNEKLINKLNDNIDRITEKLDDVNAILNSNQRRREQLTPLEKSVNDNIAKNKEDTQKYLSDKNNGLLFKQRTFEENVNYQKTRELSASEVTKLNIIRSDVSNRLKHTNVDFEVIPSSPFKNRAIDGYYDSANNKITIVGDNYSPDTIQSLLNHELTHAGIYKMTKNYDRNRYDSELEQLAKNPELNELANKLVRDLPEQNLTRSESINEALSVMAENGTFRKLKGIEKFYNFLRDLVNKVLGREQITSFNQIQDYIARANEFTLNESNVKTIDSYSANNSKNYINDVANMPKEIMFSEKPYDAETVKRLNEIVKPFLNAKKDEQVLMRNSKEFNEGFDKVTNKINELLDGAKDKNNWTHVVNQTTRIMASVRRLASESDSGQLLQNTFDKGDTLTGFLDKLTNNDINEGVLLKLSNSDDTGVNTIIRDASHVENKGDGKRLTTTEVKQKLIDYRDAKGNPIKDLDKAFQVYQIRRKNLDNILDKTYLLRTSDAINQIERLNKSAIHGRNADGTAIVKESNFVNGLKAARLKALQEGLSKPEEFYEATNITPAKDNGNLLELDLSIDENAKINETLKEYLAGMSENYNNAKFSRDQLGYAPKDHSGKFTAKMSTLIIDADGNPILDSKGKPQELIFGVQAFSSAFERNSWIRAYNKLNEELYAQGKLKDPNEIKIVGEDRQTEVISNLNANQFMQQAERSGYTLDDNLRRQIFAVSESHKFMDRKFKEGIGQSIDFDKISSQHLTQLNKDIGRSVYYNDEINVFKSVTDNATKDLLIQMQNAKQKINDSDAFSAKLRGVGSVWALGWNVSSAGLQTIQFMQAAPSWMGQYSGGTGVGVTTKSIGLAAKYLKDGSTGNKALDTAIKDFTNPLLGAQQTDMLFNTKNGDQYKRDSTGKLSKVLNPFFLFGKAEELNRLTTFIASHDVFYNRDKYQSRKEIGNDFHAFAIENLVKVNGDYSAYNRPKILQGPVAQTLFMFQQYKVFMYEMFKHMDPKAKGMFIATMALTAGTGGIAGLTNVEDIADFLLKMFNIPFSTKRFINDGFKHIGENLGINNFETYAQNGLFPSVGSRTALGDFVPFIGPALDIAGGGDVGQNLQKEAGPVASLAVNTQKGLGSLFRGDLTQSIREFAPSAVKNVVKAGQQSVEGYDINTSGTARNATADYFDAGMQAFGFKTVSLINQAQDQQQIQSAKSLQKNIGDYYRTEYLRHKLKGNEEQAQQVIDDAKTYNNIERRINSGYAFNFNVGDWNRAAKQSLLPQTERTLEKSNKIIQKSFQ